MVEVTINGRTLRVLANQTILEVARHLDIDIPTLCFHPDLTPVGSCRLCLVEVVGVPRQVSACTFRVMDGMVVHTNTSGIAQSRRRVLEFLLQSFADSSDAGGQDSEFMRWVRYYGVPIPSAGTYLRYPVDSDPHPFLRLDLNRCILCTRCVRACNEVQGRFVWHLASRGAGTQIVAGVGTTMLEAGCESCGACAAYCPTGAIQDRRTSHHIPVDQRVMTTCGYCGVGCQFNLEVHKDRVVRVSSSPHAPVNGMALCVKGRYGFDYLNHEDRLKVPRVRKYLLDNTETRKSCDPRGEWIEVEWDVALDLVARKLNQIVQESGSDALGILASAKCTNEENYLLQKMSRQVLGTHNIDHCARLCHASTLAGLSMCFGSGAMSNSMDDVAEHAAAFFIIGSNTTEQHPVFGARIRQAVLRRGAKLVVADPRKIDIAELATLHLKHMPGTDVALLNGIMHLVHKREWHDQAFIDHRCEGFAEFLAAIEQYTPERVASISGVSVADLHKAAQILANSRPLAVIWAMGITQHTTGVLNVLSLGNLQMLLGNIGVPGGGVNPLRGQNNVQGACDMGALPNVFPGYQSVTDPIVINKFEQAWSVRPVVRNGGRHQTYGLSSHPGLTVMDMIEGAGSGRLRGLYIVGEDPAMTHPDSNHARKCLAGCEFLVLQEILPSETSDYADVLLPGAAFAEKTGTFTNTERRVQLVRQAISPPGDARPDWQITADLARRMLALQGREACGQYSAWRYGDSAQILSEVAALTPSYAGVSYERLQRGERIQWPVPRADHPGTPILHVGEFTRGKGKFHAVDHLPPAELPDQEFPFILTTGRVLYHWHGGELTRRVEGLIELYPESLVEIHPDDAARLTICTGARVRVTSRRGTIIARAIVTDRVTMGVIFGNFHFPGLQNANNLTIGALDPVAKIPEYKVCAVTIASESATE